MITDEQVEEIVLKNKIQLWCAFVHCRECFNCDNRGFRKEPCTNELIYKHAEELYKLKKLKEILS